MVSVKKREPKTHRYSQKKRKRKKLIEMAKPRISHQLWPPNYAKQKKNAKYGRLQSMDVNHGHLQLLWKEGKSFERCTCQGISRVSLTKRNQTYKFSERLI